MKNSDNNPLSNWLVYDSFLLSISGVCPKELGTYTIKIIASDNYNPTISTDYKIEIYNHPPEIK